MLIYFYVFMFAMSNLFGRNANRLWSLAFNVSRESYVVQVTVTLFVIRARWEFTIRFYTRNLSWETKESAIYR